MRELRITKGSEEVGRYYEALKPLFETLSGEGGFYNIGWLPPGSKAGFQEGQRRLVELVTEPLRHCPEGVLLDAGCGRAAPARLTAGRLGRKVIGLDILVEQLKPGYRPENSEAITLLKGDACRIPLLAGSVAGVYSIESAFHYPDKAGFVREVSRVLVPGGIFSLTDIMQKAGLHRLISVRKFQAALAAPNLFSIADYLEAASACGLEMTAMEDLTPGAMRSLRTMTPILKENLGGLRTAGIRQSHLTALILGARLLPHLHSLAPVRYQWILFRKN